MATSKFEKSHRHPSVFQCLSCNRETRDTGDNGAVELCPECNESALIENGICDEYYVTASALDAAKRLVHRLNQKAVNKGGVIAGYAAA